MIYKKYTTKIDVYLFYKIIFLIQKFYQFLWDGKTQLFGFKTYFDLTFETKIKGAIWCRWVKITLIL